MRKTALWIILVALAATATGCHLPHLIAYLAKDEYKDIPAEHKLEAEKLVIVPYVTTDVQFEHPALPVSLSQDIIAAMTAEGVPLPSRVHLIEHPVAVVRWQESNLEWPAMSLADIGRRFKADTVLYVEVLRYSLIEERSANLLRGRASARVQVVKPAEGDRPVYETTVEAVYPENRPVGVLETSERVIRHATNVTLAENIVNKFYDRRVKVTGGGS